MIKKLDKNTNVSAHNAFDESLVVRKINELADEVNALRGELNATIADFHAFVKETEQAEPLSLTFMCPHFMQDGWPCRNVWHRSSGDICPKCHRDWREDNPS